MSMKEEFDNLVWGLLRGLDSAFEVCAIIQEGVSYEKIPEDFWLDERKGKDILGAQMTKKEELIQVRQEVIARIISELINGQDVVYVDHYSRLFHALAILEVPKDDSRIPNYRGNSYHLAYELWQLDDGQQETYKHIAQVAWRMSEIMKTISL